MPVVVPVGVGVAFWWWGEPGRAVVVWSVALVVLVLVLLGVPVQRYVAVGASAVAHGVGVVLTGAVGVVLVVVGAVLRLVGRDPLTPRSERGNGWKRASSAVESARLAGATFGLEPAVAASVGGRRSWGRRLVMGLGVVALVVLVDLGVGLVWERVSGSGSPVAGIVDGVNFTGQSATRADPRAELPSMAAYPWADAYLREIQTTPNSYWPFTESRPLRFEGEFVNIEGWSRRSYVPEGLARDAPVVWMFGGSTTWGEGQRDEHTIASELARISEREGTPVRVVNYGQRGWTHFQEMVLFEQLLAEGPPPDVALFYDGANEINAQSLSVKGVPTHVLVDQYAEMISGGIAEEVSGEQPAPPSSWALAWDAYSGHSALQKLVRNTRAFVDPEAGAAPAAPSVGAGDGAGTQGQTYSKSADDAERAMDVYERGRNLTRFLAERYDVQPVFLWQPVLAGPAELRAIELVSDPTIDISDTLDEHVGVYIDGGHTNEEGARLVAERIWAEVEGDITALYEDGRSVPARPGQSSQSTTTTTTTTTNLEDIAAASAELDRAADDPCALRRWSYQLGLLRAATPDEVALVVALAQRYVGLLTASAAPEQASAVQVVSSVAQQLRSIAAAAEVLPNKPFLPQLALAAGPFAEFPAAVEVLIASEPAGTTCG